MGLGGSFIKNDSFSGVLESCKKSQTSNFGHDFRGSGFEWDKYKRGFCWKYNKLGSLQTVFQNSLWLGRYANIFGVSLLKLFNFPELRKMTSSPRKSYKWINHGLYCKILNFVKGIEARKE